MTAVLSHHECAPQRRPPARLAAQTLRTIPALTLDEVSVLVVLRTRCGCEQRRYQHGRPTSTRITVRLCSGQATIADEPIESERTRTFCFATMTGDPWSGVCETWLFVEEDRP